jgi:hypothetical protein
MAKSERLPEIDALRGLAIVLIVLEQTLLRCFGWYFNFDYRYMNAGIVWGTGWAMVFLALVLAAKMSPIWVVLLWVLVIAILYPACLVYGRYKRSHDHAWLQYL